MATNYLFDTNIFIEYLRNPNALAAGWIDRVARKDITAGISHITTIELWIGLIRPKDEPVYKVLLAPFRKYDINRRIAIRTAELWRPYRKTDASLSDFLIAATAEYYRADIVTRNVKHFHPLNLKDIRIIDPDN